MKTLTTLVMTTILTLTVGCSMTGPARADDSYFSQAELDSMLAPVALYPDSVLSHVLIAATYPLEVIQAARFSREHPGLRGEDAVAAVEGYDWDPSVKALVAFPDLLERMDEDLDWTQDLGDAFLVQEDDVIASIQYLRSEAYSQGHLKSNDRVKVVREKEYIYIEPARTRVVYVPYYDPRVVYSSWRWSSHPPRYWHRPSGFNVSVGFHWGRPYTIRPSFYFSSFHWAQRRVVVVNHHHHYYRDHRFRSGREVARFSDARHWKHDPVHRRGVSYRGRVEQTRFVESSRSSLPANRKSAQKRDARREWAEQRRSRTDFSARTSSSQRGTSRSDRVAELRGSSRGNQSARVESRERDSSRAQTRSTQRAASESRERNRSVTGRAPERASSSERASSRVRSSGSTRSSADRAGRVSESLRGSSSGSRESAASRSRGVERSSERSGSARSSRKDSLRSSTSVPRGLTVRSSESSRRSSAPARSSRSFSSSSRGAASSPSRQSAPSRSRSSSRESSPTRSAPSRSAPSRSAPRAESSRPSRSSKSSSPPRSRTSTPSRSGRSSAPARSSRGSDSSRSSRGSAPSRSRGGDSRRGGGRGDERK